MNSNVNTPSALNAATLIHKQTVYIIQDEKGELNIFQYAPTMNYAGQKDSDQYSLMQGLFIDEPSHDLWMGEVKCHRNYGTSSGINTVHNLTCTIISKRSFVWDMAKPMGQRETEVKERFNFKELINKIRNPNKKSSTFKTGAGSS